MIKRILAAAGSVLVFAIFIFIFVVPRASETPLNDSNTLRGMVLWNLDWVQAGPVIYNSDGSWILGYPRNMPVFDENGNYIELEEIVHGTVVEVVHTGTILNTSPAQIASPLSVRIIENVESEPVVIYAALLWESEWDPYGPIFLGEKGHFHLWNMSGIPVIDRLGNAISITEIPSGIQVKIWYDGLILESYPYIISTPISIRATEPFVGMTHPVWDGQMTVWKDTVFLRDYGPWLYYTFAVLLWESEHITTSNEPVFLGRNGYFSLGHMNIDIMDAYGNLIDIQDIAHGTHVVINHGTYWQLPFPAVMEEPKSIQVRK